MSETECRYPCGCDQFADEHCACMDGHAAREATDPTPGEVGLSEGDCECRWHDNVYSNDMRRDTSVCLLHNEFLRKQVERILAATIAARDAEVEAAQAEASNAQADWDRRGERLWRLAGLTGYVPTTSDNDATAEMVIADALNAAEAREAELRATVERVRETERRAAWDWFLESLEAHMLKGQPVWDEAVAHRRELLSRAALTTPPTTEAGK